MTTVHKPYLVMNCSNHFADLCGGTWQIWQMRKKQVKQVTVAKVEAFAQLHNHHAMFLFSVEQFQWRCRFAGNVITETSLRLPLCILVPDRSRFFKDQLLFFPLQTCQPQINDTL